MLSLLLALAARDAEPMVVEGVLCHPGRMMVKLSQHSSLKSISNHGFRIVRHMPEIGWAVVEIPEGRHVESRRRLERISGVRRVEFDRAARLAYDPNDAMWPDMWHMRAVRANLAWDQTFGSSDVVVAIMDTGVKWDHPDLVDNAWINADEVPGNAIDDDGNGYVDDVHGYDFAYGDSNPNDVHGHGTACAGLAAAVQDNTIGVTGVAPMAKIMPLKAAIDSGYFYDSANVPAYLYAAANGAKVISCSFFSDRVSQSERDAIDYVWSQGVLPVVAAGNDNTVWPYYPAGYENSLAVGAVGSNLSKAGFSNFGSWVDVAAPGTSLRTTSIGTSGYTSGFGGTSGACPHVAGLAALLFGVNPNATAREVRNAIEDSASPTQQTAYGEWTNYGLIRADDAVAALANPFPPKTPKVRYMTPLGVSGVDPIPPAGHYRARIHGRGFQPPRNVEVRFGANTATILEQTRDWVDVILPAGSSSVQVWVDGLLVSEIDRPAIKKLTYPLIEANTDGATLSGGFDQALRADGSSIIVSRRTDGTIRMEGTFRGVLSSTGNATFNVRRRYLGATQGTEKIYLYNWTSGSFPYGSFTEIRSYPASPDWVTLRVKMPRVPYHTDPEGTMYLLIVAEDVNSGATLEVDHLYIARN